MCARECGTEPFVFTRRPFSGLVGPGCFDHAVGPGSRRADPLAPGGCAESGPYRRLLAGQPKRGRRGDRHRPGGRHVVRPRNRRGSGLGSPAMRRESVHWRFHPMAAASQPPASTTASSFGTCPKARNRRPSAMTLASATRWRFRRTAPRSCLAALTQSKKSDHNALASLSVGHLPLSNGDDRSESMNSPRHLSTSGFDVPRPRRSPGGRFPRFDIRDGCQFASPSFSGDRFSTESAAGEPAR